MKITSIRKKLSVGLMVLALSASLLTALFTFFYSFKSAYSLQDDILQQTAYLVDEHSQTPEVLLNNHDNRILIQNHNTDPQQDYFIADLDQYEEGFHTISKGNIKYRFYLKTLNQQKIAVIFDESEFRDEIIVHSIWLSTVPVLLFILLMLPLAIWIIGCSIAPIDRLAKTLQARSENDLTALETDNVPQELRGFIHSINQMLDKVAASMRQQKRFIADASHELRSPMTALSLQAERLIKLQQLQNHGSEQTGVLEQANALSQGIQRIRHLLEQLLSLARLQAGAAQSDSRQSAVSILAVYRQVLADLLPLADEKAIDIGLVSDVDVSICADQSDIYILLKTLCENSVTYVPPGGQVDLAVCLFQDSDGEWLMLEVDDNGNGIPPEERLRVLDPFYRVLGSGQQGTGLGLAIANSIVKRYHGKIILSDSKRFAHGLNSTVYLPIGLCSATN
ncbi:ATP-binding protein [Testudinibacter sp. TR-2022]|uniref:ATP-binding protein n=1 Tax=Testudinibacter sp. TR-2022 TaxID=2585029 RepID=UPI00111BB62F|nr:ATP-binding protein [Testudinibacter sp. TR-2022]TNH08832.1 HAMP domain-containing protein [Pasteurellaceae bacterium Phil11]TNH25878.1 HAMP domain-containing protein [Testudinibacter sp. TR-2022]TNH28457.1 HAMP domain-containing protein [Testudinibacter sp. TR-2022]